MLAPMMVFSISAAKLHRPMARTRLLVSCGTALLVPQRVTVPNKCVRILSLVRAQWPPLLLGLEPTTSGRPSGLAAHEVGASIIGLRGPAVKATVLTPVLG